MQNIYNLETLNKKTFFTKEAKRYKHLYDIFKKCKCRRIMGIGV